MEERFFLSFVFEILRKFAQNQLDSLRTLAITQPYISQQAQKIYQRPRTQYHLTILINLDHDHHIDHDHHPDHGRNTKVHTGTGAISEI